MMAHKRNSRRSFIWWKTGRVDLSFDGTKSVTLRYTPSPFFVIGTLPKLLKSSQKSFPDKSIKQSTNFSRPVQEITRVLKKSKEGNRMNRNDEKFKQLSKQWRAYLQIGDYKSFIKTAYKVSQHLIREAKFTDAAKVLMLVFYFQMCEHESHVHIKKVLSLIDRCRIKSCMTWEDFDQLFLDTVRSDTLPNPKHDPREALDCLKWLIQLLYI